jgi:glutamate dehydrogenase (NAD(P)+)
MGTGPADIATVLRAAGVAPPRRQPDSVDSGRATALTVYAGVAQALRRQGRPLAGRTVAIEGFGRVGRPLAERLVGSGARVVAISTSRGALYDPDGLDVVRLAGLAADAGSAVVDRYGAAERLPAPALLELPVDVLCPCARHGSVHAGNVHRVSATAVVPGANNPVTPEAEAALAARGVDCLPDFVTNAGGVLGGTMAFAGIAPARIDALLDSMLGACVALLLDEADRRGVTPRVVAEPVARRRHARLRRAAEQPSAVSHLFASALASYRRGWLPRWVVARLAERYFARNQAALLADLREGAG